MRRSFKISKIYPLILGGLLGCGEPDREFDSAYDSATADEDSDGDGIPNSIDDEPNIKFEFSSIDIAINDKAKYTTSTAVSLELTVNRADQMLVSNGKNCEAGNWEAYSKKLDWNLTEGDGLKAVSVKFREKTKESVCHTRSIILDTTAPQDNTITINGGAEHTFNQIVDLNINSGDARKMAIADTLEECSTSEEWEEFSTEKKWTLEGSRIFLKLKDEAGNVSECSKDKIAVVETFGIVGPSHSNKTSIEFAFDANGAKELLIAADSECGSGGWETFGNKTWTPTDLNASNTMYAKFRDEVGNESPCISHSLVHDNIAPTGESVSIELGASHTSSSTVTLYLNVKGASGVYLTQTAECKSGGEWSNIDGKKPWTLSKLNSENSVYVKFRDKAGNETKCVNDSINHDSTAPSSNISINSGDDFVTTSSPDVTLTFNASEASEMYITNTQGCSSGGSWEKYSGSKSWTLGQTESKASVYAKFRDTAGNESDCLADTITHDSKAPSNPTIKIAGGDSYTTSTSVTLTLAASEASQMYITNTADCSSGGTWEAYGTSKSWTLSQTNKTATTYIKFRDEAGLESSCVSDTIIHDSQSPTDASISIDSGASHTSSTSVTLTLAATGASQIYVTNTSGCSSGGTWETYAETKNWALGEPNATAATYTKFKDEAGNESPCISDSIIHDNQAPTDTSISISSGASYVTSTATSLGLSATGANQMYITNTAGCSSGGAWETYATTKVWTISQTNATATVYVKFRDQVENSSNCISDTVIHDGIDPSIPSSVNDGISTSSSTTSPTISWSKSTDTGSGIAGYQLAIGTTSGATDIKDWADVENVTEASVTELSLNWGNTYFASVRAKDDSGNVSTSANGDGFIYGWVHAAYLKAPAVDDYDYFGYSVDVSGKTIVVGAYEEDSNQSTITNGSSASSDNSSNGSGAVYVFKSTNSSWVQESYIKASNSDSKDSFGYSVALSGDILAVGATREDSGQTTITNSSSASTDNSKSSSGAVYIFTRSGSSWTQEAYIKAPNSGVSDEFGRTIGIDSDTIVVGAYVEDSNQTNITNGTTATNDDSSTDSGAVYVFRRTNSAWTQEAYIKPSNSDQSDLFGLSLAISGDTLVVGALYEDSNQSNLTNGDGSSTNNSLSNSGAAYIFRRTGTTWVQEAYLKSPAPGEDEEYGCSVAISGETVVVGARREDSNQNTITNGTSASTDNSTRDSGAAYVYTRSGSTWTQEAYIKPSNNCTNCYFGSKVDIDSNTIAVGTAYEDSNQTTITNGATASTNRVTSDTGAVYVFTRNGSTWIQRAYIKSPNGEYNDSFGGSVAISGSTIIVGALNEDSNQTTITNGQTGSSDNSLTSSGAAYVITK